MTSFFFNDTSTTQIYTLSLHDALPISAAYWNDLGERDPFAPFRVGRRRGIDADIARHERSEEHTSELQSPDHLVCRLLLEKKNNAKDTLKTTNIHYITALHVSHNQSPL